MRCRNGDTRKGRSARALLAAAAVLGVLSTAPLGAQAAPASSAEAWMGFWTGEQAKAQFELRPADGGTYEVAVVWVAEDVEERGRRMVGERIIWGLSWNPGSSRFVGGTARMERDGRTAEASCELRPRKDGNLEFRAGYGFLSRSVVWVRVQKPVDLMDSSARRAP